MNKIPILQKIQKAIERLAFVDCKARIYTVSGTATMNNGLVIQVSYGILDGVIFFVLLNSSKDGKIGHCMGFSNLSI